MRWVCGLTDWLAVWRSFAIYLVNYLSLFSLLHLKKSTALLLNGRRRDERKKRSRSMTHAIAARSSRYEEKCFNCRVPKTYNTYLYWALVHEN